ncbi:MAG: hypothetical protein QM500_14440 [Methylococcales bacterium]
MSNCHVSNQIAEHCNEEESYCPECGGNMYENDYDIDLFECSECEHTNQDEAE